VKKILSLLALALLIFSFTITVATSAPSTLEINDPRTATRTYDSHIVLINDTIVNSNSPGSGGGGGGT